MSDARARELERRWRAGDLGAKALLIRACERAGEVRCDLGLHDVEDVRPRSVIEDRVGSKGLAIGEGVFGAAESGLRCEACGEILRVQWVQEPTTAALWWYRIPRIYLPSNYEGFIPIADL